MISDNSQAATSPFGRPFRVLLIACWFGLATGLAEASFLVVYRQHLRHNIINQSQDILWMAPLAELLIFSLVGGLVALGAWLRPRLISVRVVGFVFAFLSFMALLLLFPQLNRWAALLLATGAAFQTSRLMAAHPQGFASLARRTSVWLIVVVIGLGFGLRGWQAWSEHRALAKLPAARVGAPNVLLIVLDTVRASSLSLYGYERRTTPQLERVAERGALFDRAIATSGWTLPSHGSMFTGHFPDELSFGWRKPLETPYPTLAEVLSQNGYENAGFVGNLPYCSKEQGLARGMIHYEDYPVSLGQIVLSSTIGKYISNTGWIRRAVHYHDALDRKNAARINNDFLSWVSDRHQERPFFAFVNYYDAHEPLLPPEPFASLFGGTKPSENFEYHGPRIEHADHESWGAEAIEQHRNAYDSSIAFLDHHLALLFAELKRRGILENTLVIITSDHGELLGERGQFGHGYNLHRQIVHVPLVMVFPSRVPAGVRIEQPVSLRDLPETVLNLVGFDKQTPFPGETLARYWDAPSDKLSVPREVPALSELEEVKSLVTRRYHYLCNKDGSEELYEWSIDPGERCNLAQSETGRAVIMSLRTSLESALAKK